MGTKNNPGIFDCYANAEPNEPMFVLLGRDKHAPALVRLWAEMRRLDGEEPAKVSEAVLCAAHMESYRAQRERVSSSPISKFIDECMRHVSGARTSAGELYNAYVTWCAGGLVQPVSAKRFNEIIRERYAKLIGAETVWIDCQLIERQQA